METEENGKQTQNTEHENGRLGHSTLICHVVSWVRESCPLSLTSCHLTGRRADLTPHQLQHSREKALHLTWVAH